MQKRILAAAVLLWVSVSACFPGQTWAGDDEGEGATARKSLCVSGLGGTVTSEADIAFTEALNIFPDSSGVVFDEKGQGLVTEAFALNPENVIASYQKGIFPWVDFGETAGWFVLKDRGVVNLSEIHIPKSLAKEMRRSRFIITFDKAFETVMRQCSTVPRATSAWIEESFIRTYTELHHRGLAHSVEVWLDGVLVGGLYGVHINGVYSGESMFHLVDNASKFAALALIDHLRTRGVQWIDTQQLLPGSFFAQIGGRTVAHGEYLAMLARAQEHPISFYPEDERNP